MDRIALISDIHGNMPALEATLQDIQRRDIGRIFCLGDLVGKGPDSDQVVDLCRQVCEATVRGNWDDFIVTQPEHSLAQWHQARLGRERFGVSCAPAQHDRVFHERQACAIISCVPDRRVPPRVHAWPV